MTPAEMSERIKEEVDSSLAKVSRKLITQVSAAVMGYEMDAWGHVQSVSQSLVARVRARIPDEKIKEALGVIVKAVERRILTKATAEEIAKTIVKQLSDDLYARARKEVEAELMEEIYAQVRKEVQEKHKELSAAWHVANRLKGDS